MKTKKNTRKNIYGECTIICPISTNIITRHKWDRWCIWKWIARMWWPCICKHFWHVKNSMRATGERFTNFVRPDTTHLTNLLFSFFGKSYIPTYILFLLAAFCFFIGKKGSIKGDASIKCHHYWKNIAFQRGWHPTSRQSRAWPPVLRLARHQPKYRKRTKK